MESLKDLTAFVENKAANYTFPASPKNLYEPLSYFLNLGGKRLRPVLTLISGNIFGVPKEESIHAALAIEIFHNFSLIHDDIMDEAPVRRGMPTVHSKWNRNIAILAGDVLYTEAFRLLAKYADDRLPLLLERFSATAIEVCEGQQLDMDFEQETAVSKQDYVEMIRLKTSVLVGCALELGAILGRAGEASRKAIYDFGVELGIAFQIQDDLLDLYGDPETFGKQTGGDVLANKKTLLLLSALEIAGQNGDDRVEQLLRQEATTEKVSAAMELFTEIGARAATEAELDHHYEKALRSLETLDARPEAKAVLKQLAEQLIARKS
jgi:geranylgeranyl diphosphate synthase, type II